MTQLHDTPGEMAVAAVWGVLDKYGQERVQVVFVSHGPEPYYTKLMSEREARQTINLTIRDLEQRVLYGDEPVGLRQVQGGAWVCRARCPDGVIRQFIERKRTPSKRVPRVGMSAATRWTVLERDGFRCRYCGRAAPDVELAVDHVVSVVDGGTDDPINLTASCVECNGGKGRRSIQGGGEEQA